MFFEVWNEPYVDSIVSNVKDNSFSETTARILCLKIRNLKIHGIKTDLLNSKRNKLFFIELLHIDFHFVLNGFCFSEIPISLYQIHESISKIRYMYIFLKPVPLSTYCSSSNSPYVDNVSDYEELCLFFGTPPYMGNSNIILST